MKSQLSRGLQSVSADAMLPEHETINIRPTSPDDAQAVADIYNHYIRLTIVTFEEASVTREAMAARIEEGRAASLPWLVAAAGGKLVGFAFASKWKGRCAYRLTAETTIYLDVSAAGKGIGTVLYSELLERLSAQGFHTAIGGIALPNDASVRLHEKLGFTKVAHFKQVGFKFDRWVDVAYWQKFF